MEGSPFIGLCDPDAIMYLQVVDWSGRDVYENVYTYRVVGDGRCVTVVASMIPLDGLVPVSSITLFLDNL